MDFWSDLRYGARVLRKSPGFAAVSIVTLAFGIGATTATFSTADGMMWKPLPLRDLPRLAVISQRNPADPADYFSDAPADLTDLAARASTLEGIAWWETGRANIVGSGGEPERVDQYLVTANFFDVLGEQPALGRGFMAGEDEAGHEREVVLSDRLWRRRFGADAGLVGKTIRLDDENYAVVGVMPPHAAFPKSAELWTPAPFTAKDRRRRDRAGMMAVARLKPGRTVAEAEAEVSGISRQLAAEYPATNRERRYQVMGLQEFLIGYYNRHYVTLLLGAVGFVLLIACVNVANLQLARALGRGREVALRVALGAGRGRLIRQLLTESVLLALGGGLLGLVVASWSLDLIVRGMPPEVGKYVSGWDQIHLDGRALAATLTLSLLTGILAGVAPAFQYSRPDLAGVLKEGGRGASAGRGRHRLRSILVAAEIALAVVLLVGAALMVRSFAAMARGSAGLEPQSLLTLRLAITETKYRQKHEQARFYETVLERMAALPGVKSAAAAMAVPYSDHSTWRVFRVEGQPDDPAHGRDAEFQWVSPSYFATLRVPLRAGRLLMRADGPETPPVAVLDEYAARRWFGGADPLGKRIRAAGDENAPWMTVVGVVGNQMQSVYDRGPQPIVFVPFVQQPHTWMDIAVRTAGNPLSLATAATAAIRSVDPEQPVTDVATLQTLVERQATGIIYVAVMLGAFGLLALGLAAIGVYGTMSYLVTEQFHEIGIRMALGAPQGSVFQMVFRRGLGTAGAGLAVGLGLSYLLARLMSTLLWGVTAADPATFAAIPLVLIAAAALAIYIPARRAVRIDPVVALR
jgi:putative ABC transport system permease protein